MRRNDPRKTLVLGVGNVLMGDEGVGVHAVRSLEQMELPANVECLDGGTGSFLLLEPMQSAEKIILVDATADGQPAGTVSRLQPRFSSDYPPTLTAHDIGLKDLLDAFYLLGGPGEVVLYAVSIKLPQDITTELSPEIATAAERVAHLIAQEVNQQAGEGRIAESSEDWIPACRNDPSSITAD